MNLGEYVINLCNGSGIDIERANNFWKEHGDAIHYALPEDARDHIYEDAIDTFVCRNHRLPKPEELCDEMMDDPISIEDAERYLVVLRRITS